jgi:pyrimidine operon attenuation protein/uracil phosphoribosyltransferase
MNVISRPPNLREKGQIMSASEIERTLVRLAHEIVEKNNGIGNLGLIGIRRRGIPIAERIARHIERIEKSPVPVGSLDITLYRDDLSTVGPKPVVEPRPIGFNITDKDVVICDDVLYTGRTVRAALDALFDQGRPRSVRLLTLIDRGHRELPIEATFVGRRIQTSDLEMIEVKLMAKQGTHESQAPVAARDRAAGLAADPRNSHLGEADESSPPARYTSRTPHRPTLLRKLYPHPHQL